MSKSSKSKAGRSESQDDDQDLPSCYSDTHGVMTTTTNDLAGYRIVKQLGAIYGLTVRARNWGMDLGGLLKSSVGGEIRPFTTMLYRARNHAMDRLVGECMARGGNAVLAVRFDIAAQGALSQVCAYGTAVIVEEIKPVNQLSAQPSEQPAASTARE